jgi:hypothetical protein
VVTLRRDSVDWNHGRIHVRRVKGSADSVHPISGRELRALRRLKREQDPASPFIFASERGAPFSTAGLRKMLARLGEAAGFDFRVHPHMLRHACGFKLANDGVDTRSLQAWGRGYVARPTAFPDCRYRGYRCGVAGVKVLLLGLLLLAIGTLDASPRTQLDDLIARAKALELDTPYVPPPGDPLVHHAAGYAKVMCSAVFMTGLSPDFAAENVGFFTAAYEIRAKLGKPVVDRANKTVHITLPNGVTRTAKYLGSQGCVTFPLGESAVHFRPVAVSSQLPDASLGRRVIAAEGAAAA